METLAREQLAWVTGGAAEPVVMKRNDNREVNAKQEQLAASVKSLAEACEGMVRSIDNSRNALPKALLGLPAGK
jgi:hypothetical protein